MSDFILEAIPVLVLLSHILLAFLVVAWVNKHSWGRPIFDWINSHLLDILIAVSLVAVIGSLFYSNVIGFPPCVLCWWQRVLLFPIPVVLMVGRIKKDRGAVDYIIPLAIMSAVIAMYQSYVYLGGTSILPCTASGGDCSKIYVLAFGYITIPIMSLTTSVYLVILSGFRKFYV